MAAIRRPSNTAWRLRLYFFAALFVALVAVLIKTVHDGVSAQQQSAASRSTPTRSIPNTDVNPYGANFFLTREVEPWKREKTLRMAAEAGIGWVKQQFPWEEIEPRRKGEFLEPTKKGDSWAKYDEIVAACEEYGLRIVARLDRPPNWTRQDNTYGERPPDNLEDYGDFVYEFVKRYEGRIDYIQIWNEPNIFPEWGYRPVDPAGYVELLKIAYRRAKEANPNVYVLSAPLASTLGEAHPEPGKWTAMSDLLFLEEMYKAGAADYFDIHSANAFGMDRPPEDPPDPDVLSFQRVLLQREIMERYGDGSKAVWFNEYGWNAAPESFAPEHLIWRRVSEKHQVEYTLRGIEMARREWPWAGVFMIWYFRQVGNVPADRADYYFRVVDPDFTPRPLYLAIQDVAGRQEAAGPGRYEETNPGVKAYGRWRTAVDRSASSGSFLRSDVEGDNITFSFYGSGVDLITRRSRGSGRLLVWLDGHTVPELDADDEGRSWLELYSPWVQTRARVPLVRTDSLGEHTLRIAVAGERHEDALGQECVLDAFEVHSSEGVPFPIAPVAASSLGLVLDAWLLWRTWRHVRWIMGVR